MRHTNRTTILAVAAATTLMIGARPGVALGEGDGCDDSTTTTTQPTTTQPTTTQPTVTEPVVIQPVVTEPVVIQPVVIQPVVTEPAVTQPVVAQQVITAAVVTPSVLAVQVTKAAPAKPVLPATGTDTGIMAAAAASLVAAGVALVTVRRRPT